MQYCHGKEEMFVLSCHWHYFLSSLLTKQKLFSKGVIAKAIIKGRKMNKIKGNHFEACNTTVCLCVCVCNSYCSC